MPRSLPFSAPTKSDARGSAAPLLVLFVAVALLCVAAVVRAGSLMVRRANAQACADAIALALVTGGVDTATRVAHTSHSLIVDESRSDGVVHVVVHTDGITASASAAG